MLQHNPCAVPVVCAFGRARREERVEKVHKGG